MKSNDSALVSVVIPCYNHAEYLAASIESVLAQTHPQVELMVVDDGSTDQSAAVVKRYPQAKYLWQTNRGLSAARNAGLKVSKGEYVMFLDADDLLFPGALAAGLRCFFEHPDCVFVYGGCIIVSDDLSSKKECVPSPAQTSYLSFLRANQINNPGQVLYRRTAFDRVGGFDEAVSACADYDLYLRMAQIGPIACHENLVVKYRKHSGNMSGDIAHMLQTVRAVLRARKPSGDAAKEVRTAWRHGWIRYQQFYGLPLLQQALTEIQHKGQRASGLRKLGQVICQAPWVLVLPLFAGRMKKFGLKLEPYVPRSIVRGLRNLVGRSGPQDQ